MHQLSLQNNKHLQYFYKYVTILCCDSLILIVADLRFTPHVVDVLQLVDPMLQNQYGRAFATVNYLLLRQIQHKLSVHNWYKLGTLGVITEPSSQWLYPLGILLSLIPNIRHVRKFGKASP